MKALAGVVILLFACMASPVPSATFTASAPPKSLEELMAIIEAMQAQIDALESKVEALESALANGTTKAPSPVVPSGSMVMLITEIEQTPADQDTLHKIADLQADAKMEDADALDAEREAEKYISQRGRSSYDKELDASYDAKRKAALERAGNHHKKAKALRTEAAQLQRRHDERGPIIRGWNGERRIALEMTKTLPAGVRTLRAGEFITWKGSTRSSDATLEVWTASTVERTQRPAGFKEESE